MWDASAGTPHWEIHKARAGRREGGPVSGERALLGVIACWALRAGECGRSGGGATNTGVALRLLSKEEGRVPHFTVLTR